MKFRLLKADEIDCRVQTVKKTGCSLLLYKDARCDMNILDETVGAMNWQRKHTRDNANCIVSIWDSEKSQWIEKEDTGTESFTEKEKGLASDSFKRACFNWGIGRELYTAPFIWIKLTDNDISEYGGKVKVKVNFLVSKIGYKDGKIDFLEIKDNKGKIRYTYGSFKSAPKPANFRETILDLCKNDDGGFDDNYLKIVKDELERMGFNTLDEVDYELRKDFAMNVAKQISLRG